MTQIELLDRWLSDNGLDPEAAEWLRREVVAVLRETQLRLFTAKVGDPARLGTFQHAIRLLEWRRAQ
jgi:hypothetical protein